MEDGTQDELATRVDTAAEYNAVNAAAYATALEEEDLWKHTTFYSFVNFMDAPRLVKGAAVLDLACGSGVFSRYIASQGAAQVVGVDFSEEQIAQAHEIERCKPVPEGKIKYIVQDALTIDGTVLGQFDVAIASHYLCYAQSYEELRRMITVVSSCLKKGGRFVGVRECLDSASKGKAVVNLKAKRALKGGLTYSYELMVNKDQQNQDFSPLKFAFRNSDGSTYAFTTFPVYESTMIEMFMEAGFKINSIGSEFSFSPEGCKLFPQDLIETMLDDFRRLYWYFDVTKL